MHLALAGAQRANRKSFPRLAGEMKGNFTNPRDPLWTASRTARLSSRKREAVRTGSWHATRIGHTAHLTGSCFSVCDGSYVTRLPRIGRLHRVRYVPFRGERLERSRSPRHDGTR